MAELQELEKLLEAEGDGLRDDIELAIQALQFHQILYEDTHGARRAYDVVLRHRPFFERYFDAAGRRLIVERREGMIALLPGPRAYGWRETRLAKDETLTLLALRYLLEDGLRKGLVTESGRIEATTDDLHDAIRTIAATEPPKIESRLVEILQDFRRRGIVRVGARDPVERVTPIEVLPGVRLICTDEFAKHLVAWAETGASEHPDEDIFDFISARRGAAGGPTEETDLSDAGEPETQAEVHSGED
ncbi:DUF4194 domain-containing protein [Falsiroseomonas sp. HW251]|uniref:DUF4194 domain-containing protein n=1 Tax=Falsiroseomonas sp. HW251 TaxID=3390998 RepID=UPI003D32027C